MSFQTPNEKDNLAFYNLESTQKVDQHKKKKTITTATSKFNQIININMQIIRINDLFRMRQEGHR